MNSDKPIHVVLGRIFQHLLCTIDGKNYLIGFHLNEDDIPMAYIIIAPTIIWKHNGKDIAIHADENGASFLYNLNEQTDMWITEMPTHFTNEENMMDLCVWLNPFTYYSFSYNPATIYVKEEYYNLFSENDRRKFRFVMEGEDEYWRSTQYYVNLGPTSPELYLTLAECEAREGDEETAKALLYELRKTRMPEDEAALPATITDRNSLIRYCVEERIREQLGTGKFWLDMRRLWNDPLFQDYKENYAHPIGDEVYKLTEERLVMRIPPLVMQWNPGWQDND